MNNHEQSLMQARIEITTLRAEVDALANDRDGYVQLLTNENNTLRAEVESQVKWVKDLADSLIAEEAKTATLRAEIERLRAALEFYAAWPQGPAGNIAPLLIDAGHKARAALGECT